MICKKRLFSVKIYFISKIGIKHKQIWIRMCMQVYENYSNITTLNSIICQTMLIKICIRLWPSSVAFHMKSITLPSVEWSVPKLNQYNFSEKASYILNLYIPDIYCISILYTYSTAYLSISIIPIYPIDAKM